MIEYTQKEPRVVNITMPDGSNRKPIATFVSEYDSTTFHLVHSSKHEDHVSFLSDGFPCAICEVIPKGLLLAAGDVLLYMGE